MEATSLSTSLLSRLPSSSLSHKALDHVFLPSSPASFQTRTLSYRTSILNTGSHFQLSESKCRRNLISCCSGNGADNRDNDVPIEKRYPAFPTVVDINQIREILPHRFPFLLVDRVIEYNPGVSAVAIKNVTINDNFFPGHFPERPIMPGVLMVEAMAQVGGLVMLQPEVGGSRENFFFAGIDKVRFRKPVVAGDTLVMRMTLVKLQKRFGIAKMEGKAYVGGEVVCEGEFLMATGSE
ncbi:PREDICTED: uncharacterized protein LOC104605933 [Nelumbo nucifera]|uniref:3-hydroxyacyl-[acyl-carrier-protein] dehydratase n=2 Tax=Nelumbo nucifera TaxID=4432 RepID=A0A1U8AS47_NELNU|nr:PREDICTED: uncharacterized protein LOC104605933 [Nelumbo nucifera]DAD21900.1 TPA_asm: hypothetical protein HUJ06_023363 [Nelumbo nucifera]